MGAERGPDTVVRVLHSSVSVACLARWPMATQPAEVHHEVAQGVWHTSLLLPLAAVAEPTKVPMVVLVSVTG